MPTSDSQTKGATASLTQAKRRFLLNLGVFVCLALIVAVYMANTDGGGAPPENETYAAAEEPLSIEDRVYLGGQMLGLSEHPSMMPEYEASWAMKVSRSEVAQYVASSQLEVSDPDKLTELFFKGYTERYHDYYDDGLAHELGYKYGVKFNPALLRVVSIPTTYELLAANKEKLKSLYHISDEATWWLFCKAFQKGFDQGYYVVEEGVTVEEPYQQINLFEE